MSFYQILLMVGSGASVLVPSANGATIPSETQLVDNNLDVWTVSAGVVYKNGSAAGYSANVVLLLWWNDVIYQENSDTGWWYWDGADWVETVTPIATDIAVPSVSSPFVQIYPWDSGFGTKWTNPATLPNDTMSGAAFSPAGSAVAVAGAYSTKFVYAYPWSGSGFGTKYADPATLPSGAGTIAFTPAGTTLFAGGATSPYIYAYPWSGSGWGTKYANPASLPSGEATCIACYNDYVFMSNYTSPYVTAYPWVAGTGFGTKVSDPGSILNPGVARGIAYFNGDVLVSSYGSIRTYSWSGSAWGSLYAAPATPPSGNTCRGVAFASNGAACAVATDATPYIYAYDYTIGTGFGSKYSNPGTLPAGVGYGVKFSGSSDISVGHATSPYISNYPWTTVSGFGSKYANPGTAVGGTSYRMAFK